MNETRRRLLATGAQALLAAGLSGCMTSKLYELPEKRWATREENVGAVLLSADGKYLVALCPEFHYVFETSPALVAFLRSSLHSKGEASFKSIRIDKDGKTAVSYTVRLPDSLNADEAQLAGAMGFRKTKAWVLEESLNGTCYRAGGKAFSNLEMIRLNKTHQVTVRYEETGVPLALKLAATPVAMAADGVALLLVFPAAVLSIVPITIFFVVLANSN